MILGFGTAGAGGDFLHSKAITGCSRWRWSCALPSCLVQAALRRLGCVFSIHYVGVWYNGSLCLAVKHLLRLQLGAPSLPPCSIAASGQQSWSLLGARFAPSICVSLEVAETQGLSGTWWRWQRPQ